MLYLTFRLGADQFALAGKEIVEVLPLLRLKPWPGAAWGVKGVCAYRGQVLPVMDLGTLYTGTPTASSLSSRILVVPLTNVAGIDRLVGLLVEQATDTRDLDPAEFVSVELRSDKQLFAGPVARLEAGLLQQVTLDALVPPALRQNLFVEAESLWATC